MDPWDVCSKSLGAIHSSRTCLTALAHELKMPFYHYSPEQYDSRRKSQYGNAILSKFPFASTPLIGGGNRTIFKRNAKKDARNLGNVLRADIVVPGVGTPLRVGVVHLDPANESLRLKQIALASSFLMSAEGKGSRASIPHIILGDFNAVCRTDYDAAEWAAFEAFYIRKGWGDFKKSPQGLVWAYLQNRGYKDAYAAAFKVRTKNARGLAGDGSTSHLTSWTYDLRFRIDYIALSKDFPVSSVQSCRTLANTTSRVASDHFPVVAQIKLMGTAMLSPPSQ